jgi:molecular chaperone GrpE (heat shock protein)
MPELLSENRASAVAEDNIALAYAALLADQDAFRTRLEREKVRVIEAEKASLAQVLLDSTDDLERALKAAEVSGVWDRGLLNLMDGVRLSLAVLYKRIGDMGAERISTTGQRFDPAFAEAVGTVNVTDPAQHGTTHARGATRISSGGSTPSPSSSASGPTDAKLATATEQPL